MAYSTTGGEATTHIRSVGNTNARSCKNSCTSATVVLRLDRDGKRGSGRTKDRGEHSNPMMKAKLKLRVASMLSIAPSRSSEKDCRI